MRPTYRRTNQESRKFYLIAIISILLLTISSILLLKHILGNSPPQTQTQTQNQSINPIYNFDLARQKGIGSIRDGSGVLLFLHLQKVGGTSVWKALADRIPNYSYKPFKDRIYWYPWELESDKYLRLKNFDAIFGHFMFGIHNAIIPRKYTYITMMRDPIERIISLYYFVKESYYDPRLGDTIDEFVRYDKNNTFQMHNKDNGMVRSICGPYAHLVPFLELTDEHLDCAKSNLVRYFSLVLLTERFEESLEMIETTFGWSKIPRLRENETKDKANINQFSSETILAIQRMNMLDIQLYDFAKQIFQKQLDKIKPK